MKKKKFRGIPCQLSDGGLSFVCRGWSSLRTVESLEVEVRGMHPDPVQPRLQRARYNHFRLCQRALLLASAQLRVQPLARENTGKVHFETKVHFGTKVHSCVSE